MTRRPRFNRKKMHAKRAALFIFSLLLLIATTGQISCEHEKGSLAGDRCSEPGDCRSPLVCSNMYEAPGSRGICVYPSSLMDGAPPPRLDASPPDAFPPDTSPPDSSPPDADLPDGSIDAD